MSVSLLGLFDLHGHLPDPGKLPTVNALLLGGDQPPSGAVSHEQMLDEQARWYLDQLGPWLEQVLARGIDVFAIAGNHDFLATLPWGERLLRSLSWTYLRDQSIEWRGLRIHGAPWTPPHPHFPPWAFQQADEQLARHWAKIPMDADVVLAHGPPHGVLDEVAKGLHVGSATLAQRIQRISELQGRSPLVVCGHLHEQPGWSGSTVNAAVTTPSAALRRKAVLIEGGPGAWRFRWTDLDRPRGANRRPLLGGLTLAQAHERNLSDRLPSSNEQ